MRKKLRCGVSILLAASMILTVFGDKGGIDAVSYAAAAEEEQTDAASQFRYTQSGSSVVITGYDGQETSLAIPQEIAGSAVTEIADGAFKDNQDITGVVIPEGVATIGYQAFYGCENLQSVKIPSTITTWSEENLNNSAFEGCTGLTELTLSDGLTILGQKAFAGCTSLIEVSVPSGITSFRNNVFEGCTGLTKLTLPEGLTQIGFRAFMGCSALEEVHIPSTITGWPLTRASMATTHENECFRDCASLKKLTFAEGISTLENFQGVKGCPLLKEIEVPGSVENVTYAFKDCTSLEKVVMQPGIPQIGEYAFSGCTSLKDVTIPNTVTSVGLRAFYDCSSIEYLVFPGSVTEFGEAVSAGCTNMKGCYILADDVAWFQNPGLGNSGKLYCVPGTSAYDKYLTGMQANGREERLETCPPVQGVEAKAYSAAYDGEEHDAVTITGLKEDDKVRYSIDGEICDGVPQICDIGVYSVKVTVVRMSNGDEGLPGVSCWELEPQIQKKKGVQTIRLADIEVQEKESYEVQPELFEGEGDIVYHYYEDEALTKELAGKPTEPGQYYVQATVAETEDYAAAKSNVARIVIREGQQEQSPSPSPGTTPDHQPSTAPDQQPSAAPDQQPSAAPDPQPVVQPSPSPDDSKEVAVETVKLQKVKSTGKKTIEIQWKKCTQATGYQVWLGGNKKFTKNKKTYQVKSNKTVKLKVKKLKSKRTYYVKVRAYRKVNGKTYYGKYSSVKSVRVK